MRHTPRLVVVVLLSAGDQGSDIDACTGHLLADQSGHSDVCIHDQCARLTDQVRTDEPNGGDTLKWEEGELLEGQGGRVWGTT